MPPAPTLLQQRWLHMGCTILSMVGATTISSCCNCQWLLSSIYCTLMATNPTITPFAIYVGRLSSCFFSTGLHLAALPSLPFRERLWPSLHGTYHTFQSPESPKHTFSHTKGSLQPDGLPLQHLKSVNACLWDTTFPFERINHARSGMIHQASHQGLQHPLKRKFIFPSATVII